ncbi:hypothetical protein Bsel_1306 [[Bacillus] selenitireducens MLS10]|uniref:Uncharacterized protein n=1 Tax=Bacillus selenitireducens (strain ATCC 700615 / DSM 15326 / MLS10) TaxID=439292 RepID=D6XSN2_BACIE|nr:hypothetical protein Bsel_1306 [[Bacillus] selenitireducens MLS10]
MMTLTKNVVNCHKLYLNLCDVHHSFTYINHHKVEIEIKKG